MEYMENEIHIDRMELDKLDKFIDEYHWLSIKNDVKRLSEVPCHCIYLTPQGNKVQIYIL